MDETALHEREHPLFRGLWRHSDFMRLWVGQTISAFGSWLGALPLLAILVLDATPAQMGLLETVRSLPVLLLGLFAGVWVDRLRRRPILILADLGRAVALMLVVLATFLGAARMTHLYVAGFIMGGLSIFFDIAYRAYVPALVKRERLVEANSKLSATASLAEIGSPGLGGVLVQLLSAPLTLFLDALSFLASASALALIRRPEPAPAARPDGQSMTREIVAGLRALLRHGLLRPLAFAAATQRFFGGFYAALYGLFVLRVLGLSPAVLGLTIGIGGLGGLLGALLTGRLTARYGWGTILIGTAVVASLLHALIPYAGGPALLATGMLMAAQFGGDLPGAVYDIAELSLIQNVTPDDRLGRMNASFSFLSGTALTAGIMTGGLIGQSVGVRAAVAIAAAGIISSTLWLILSPIRGLRDLAPWKIE